MVAHGVNRFCNYYDAFRFNVQKSCLLCYTSTLMVVVVTIYVVIMNGSY